MAKKGAKKGVAKTTPHAEAIRQARRKQEAEKPREVRVAQNQRIGESVKRTLAAKKAAKEAEESGAEG